MSYDELRDRILRAEKIYRASLPQDNRKWKQTKCPKCRKAISYLEPDNFDGTVRCPHCDHVWKITKLSDFSKAI